MDIQGWMLAVAILLPLIAAVLVLLVRHYQLRGLIVVVTAVALIVNSIYFLNLGLPTEFTPESPMWGTIITILDYAILIFYIYAGLSLKNWLVLIFALTQIIPLAWWEFGAGASHALETITPAFRIDHLSVIMVLIISIVGSLICIYAIRYMKDHEDHNKLEKSRQSRFLFWLVMFLGAMNGLVLADNLMWLYFFWEVTTLACFQLIAHDLTKEAINNGARALWMNSIGGTAMIAAMIYIFFNNGQTAEYLTLSSIIESGGTEAFLLLPVALMCFTGMVKAAQMPFQGWLLGAMVAPTPVSALLHSSTMVKAGVYLVLRLAPAFNPVLGTAVAICGGFTFFAASVLAISQTTGKRVLAYSTIANLGLIIACAGINTELSIAAGILLIIFHAVSKGLLFLCAGTIEQQIGSREIEDMEGLAEKAPLTTFITITAMLSMFLPPFGMLLGKWVAIEAAYSVLPVAILFILASAVTMVFWAKWLGRLLQVVPRFGRKIEKLSLSYSVPLWTLFAGIFAFGIGVAPMYDNFVKAAVNNVVAVENSMMQGWNIVLPGAATAFSAERGIELLGSYPVLLLFAVFALAVILPLLIIKLKPEELRPVYMCGEQAGDVDTDEWYGAADNKTKLQLGGYYYEGAVGEERLNPWIYTIAIALLVVMFAVGVIL
ncbi:MAG: proton-conducting transporter membrane subunit [Syntrophaceticus sp.]|jgi:ech hydrogenase subunit A|nr:proton-conducting transporter membrane subunit [Syntrophaceticus sp.]MDD3315578.1 proton-conducting transporter membrane subunit [Syntrophaceticus sp.]MDD4359799.1 proton-conducting transporter membrane subunit [Syntrophaceticus sp.]MDD4782437.1 proton-conducting transporter membrane subunit [Syntrophaceticus sp.]